MNKKIADIVLLFLTLRLPLFWLLLPQHKFVLLKIIASANKYCVDRRTELRLYISFLLHIMQKSKGEWSVTVSKIKFEISRVFLKVHGKQRTPFKYSTCRKVLLC